MKVLFMGTPGFAVPSLRALHASKHEVVAAVTVPDKPVGRGLKVRPSAIKTCAMQLDIPVLQPADLKAPDLPGQLQRTGAGVFFVVAFRILPATIFSIPAHGTINLHASLLPRYRGAAPINWAIINGEKETGLTTFYIQERVDTGDIILQRSIPIGPDETAGDLHDRLALLGAALAVETLDLVEKGQAPRTFQEGETTTAPKLTKALARIDWDQEPEKLRNLVRGLSPVPGATTVLQEKPVKIFRLSIAEAGERHRPGTVTALSAKESYIEVATGVGRVRIEELQPEGKRRMSAGDFLRGYNLDIGDRFE